MHERVHTNTVVHPQATRANRPTIQRKMTVGSATDAMELEADRIADAAMARLSNSDIGPIKTHAEGKIAALQPNQEIVQRKLTGSDQVSMKATWGDKEKGAAYFKQLGAEKSFKEISDWVASRKRPKDPPTVAEVAAFYGITATQAAPTQDTGGFTLALPLKDDAEFAIGLDEHQNKHQVEQIMALGQHEGGKGRGKFPSGHDETWHTTNTVPYVERWLEKLDAANLLVVGKSYHSKTGENFEGAGIGYVASGTKDIAGKLYGSYHCYPLD
jgi:hypothetical protein